MTTLDDRTAQATGASSSIRLATARKYHYNGARLTVSFTASSVVITSLIIAIIAILVVWGTSFLNPPVIEQTSEPTAQLSPNPHEAGPSTTR